MILQRALFKVYQDIKKSSKLLVEFIFAFLDLNPQRQA